ncbi:MAG: hypothetical protein ACAH80_12310 [Alphaproteobacteria bacterium]
MFLIRKVFNGLTLRCCGAISLGMAVVTVIASGLFVLTAGADDTSTKSAAYTINFPEDAKSLEAMSDQILQNAEMAAAARSLAEIEPAAGAGIEGSAEDPYPLTNRDTPLLADQLFAPETPAAPAGESLGDDLVPTLH